MTNLDKIKSIRNLTEEERSLHLHYTVEFLEENIKELYEVIADDISSNRSINRLAFLSDVSDRIDNMLSK
jgi:hypothetical protein